MDTLVEKTELSAEPQALYTVDEIAAQIGKTPDCVRKQIRRYGLEPVIPLRRHQYGTDAAKYDAAALATIKEEEELLLHQKQRNAAKHIAAGMSEIGKQAFISTVVDEMTLDEHLAFTMQDLAHLLQTVADERSEVHGQLAKEKHRTLAWKHETEAYIRDFVGHHRLASESFHAGVKEEMQQAETRVEEATP